MESSLNDIKFIDTHAHLDFEYDISVEDIIVKSLNENVQKIINISSDEASLEKVINLSSTYENVYNALGIHPHDAKSFNINVENKIYSLKNNKTKGIGEIGLDYYYEHSGKVIQKKVFIKQIEIANKLNLPIVIHSRNADNDTYDILKSERGSISGVVIHCFSSGKNILKKYLDLGFYISFTGIITFKKAEDIIASAHYAPLDRIMLETDAPYLAPVPHRGKINYPSYLPFIAKKLSDIKDVDLQILSRVIWDNSIKFFNLD